MKIMNKCVDKDGTKDYQVQAFSREKSSKLIQYRDKFQEDEEPKNQSAPGSLIK